MVALSACLIVIHLACSGTGTTCCLCQPRPQVQEVEFSPLNSVFVLPALLRSWKGARLRAARSIPIIARPYLVANQVRRPGKPLLLSSAPARVHTNSETPVSGRLLQMDSLECS